MFSLFNRRLLTVCVWFLVAFLQSTFIRFADAILLLLFSLVFVVLFSSVLNCNCCCYTFCYWFLLLLLLLALFRLSITLQKIQCCLTWIDYFVFIPFSRHSYTIKRGLLVVVFFFIFFCFVYNRASYNNKWTSYKNVWICRLMLRACESLWSSIQFWFFISKEAPKTTKKEN